MSDVRTFIARLGGPTKAAAAIGVKPSAVSNWIAANRISPLQYPAVMRAAKAARVRATKGLFWKEET